jgi:Fe2+ transport system protein B
VLHAEPEFDCAHPVAARAALEKADLCVLMSPFVHGTHYADVLLPIAPFTETAGTFVNCEGRMQEFNGVVRPLGFDWRIGIGIVMSLAAREVIVGTLGTLYGMDPKSGSEGLQAALRHDLTAGGAVALLVFFAFAMQCLSTVAVVKPCRR